MPSPPLQQALDLFAAPKVYTVSEITAEIKTWLESEFLDVLVQGEISNFTAASSGHLYFVLKDTEAQIKCVYFRSKARLIKFKVEDGIQVIARGNLSVYEARGEYQLYVEFLEPKGIGSLQLAFEQLKRKLELEGLFDPTHKKSLPLVPRRIGVVTSPSGAAIQDILRILRRRHENVQVLIYPARVQGEGAAQEIAAGIRYFNTHSEADVIMVARGGGSIEDLWAFNEEVVARAIFASRIPIISAVGHETDFTIADFVADLRAPTPSAAAELVISKKSELAQQISNLEGRLIRQVQFRLSQFRNTVFQLSTSRGFASVESRLRSFRQRSDELAFRLETSQRSCLSDLRSRWGLLANSLRGFDLGQALRAKRENVNHWAASAQRNIQHLLRTLQSRTSVLEGALNALSPFAVLQRGYAICRDDSGKILRDVQTLAPGRLFSVTLARGSIEGKVERIIPSGQEKFKGNSTSDETDDKLQ